MDMDDSLFKLVSLHQLDLITIFKVSYMTNAYRVPSDIVIYGVEGKDFDLNIGLSREVSESIPRLVESILEEIRLFRNSVID